MRTRLFAGLLAGTLFMPALSHASEAKPLLGGHANNVEKFIALYDLDADGKLDWAEFESFRRTRFDATDTDHNGTVSLQEYSREFDIRRFRAMLQERDGQLKQTEQRFSALDADHNGQISRPEYTASGEHVLAQGRAALAALDDGSDHALRPRSRGLLDLPNSHTAEGFLRLYDANRDGDVAAAEFIAQRDAQFLRTDSNHDGALSAEEYHAEFAVRLDRYTFDAVKNATDKQTRVRFAALDKDDSTQMSFAEYQVSGKHLFDAVDRDRDGIVDADDATLPPRDNTASTDKKLTVKAGA